MAKSAEKMKSGSTFTSAGIPECQGENVLPCANGKHFTQKPILGIEQLRAVGARLRCLFSEIEDAARPAARAGGGAAQIRSQISDREAGRPDPPGCDAAVTGEDR